MQLTGTILNQVIVFRTSNISLNAVQKENLYALVRCYDEIYYVHDQIFLCQSAS